MPSSSFKIEEIIKHIKKIQQEKNKLIIVSHGDWDGVVGAGLLKRWIKENLNLKATVIFPFKELPEMKLDSVITIETSNFAFSSTNSIIIDHHIQRKEYNNTNLILIENQNYDNRSVATFIKDLFNIEVKEDFLNIIEDIDNGKINLLEYVFNKISPNNIKNKNDVIEILKNSPDSIKLYSAFRSDPSGFPKNKIINWIYKNDLNSLYEWVTKKCEDFSEVIISMINILKNNTIKVPNANAIIIKGINRENNPQETQALRPVSLYLQKRYKIVISLFVNNNNQVLSGSIGTLDKSINFELNGFYTEFEKLPEIRSVGGRTNVGGFQFHEESAVQLNEFVKKLNAIIKKISLNN